MSTEPRVADESSGYVEVEGYRLFYRSFGPSRGLPTLLALHGGPGASHDYLRPIADLADRGFRVILFDQLGCGRSDVPDDPSLFSLEHNVLETEILRERLELGAVHLLGSSYGGLLAIAYTIAHPDRVLSLITVGGLASVPFASQEMQRLIETLPPEVRRALSPAGGSGAPGDPTYDSAVREFYRRFLCRLPEWPEELTTSLELAASHPVYSRMNGPNEFTISGTIRDIDLAAELHQIRVPTLVLGGRYDEVTPRVAEQIRQGIPGARSVTFERSSHVPFWEERERFLTVVSEFLRTIRA